MKQEKWINELVDDLKPVKPFERPSVRFFYWVLIYLILIIPFALYISPMRKGFLSQMNTHPLVLIETLLAFSTFFFGGLCSFALLIPGYEPRKSLYSAVIAGFGFLGFGVYNLLFSDMPVLEVGKRPNCLTEIVAYSVLALGLFLLFMRNSLPLARQKIGFIIAGASTSLPVGLMHIGCMYSPKHVFIYHLVPMIILTFVLGLAVLLYLKSSKS